MIRTASVQVVGAMARFVAVSARHRGHTFLSCSDFVTQAEQNVCRHISVVGWEREPRQMLHFTDACKCSALR